MGNSPKMEPGSSQLRHDDAAGAQSIPSLVASLQCAFRAVDFAGVEAKLVAREKRLRDDLEAKVKENTLLQEEKIKSVKECSELKKLNRELQDECNALNLQVDKCKKEIIELRGENSVLKTEAEYELKLQKTKAEFEIQLYHNRFAKLQARVSFMAEEVSKLSDRDGKTGCEGCVKRKEGEARVLDANGEPNVDEKGCQQGSRDAEKEVLAGDRESNASGMGEGDVDAGDVRKKFEKGSDEVKDKECATRCGDNVSLPTSGGEGSGCHLTDNGSAKGAVSGSKRSVLEDIIEIADSDDECGSCEILDKEITEKEQVDISSDHDVDGNGTRSLKRKQPSSVSGGGNDSDGCHDNVQDFEDPLPGKHEMVKCQKLTDDNVQDFEDPLRGKHEMVKRQKLTDEPDSLVRNHCSKTKMSPGSNVGGEHEMVTCQNLTDAPDSLVRNHCSKTEMSPGSNVRGKHEMVKCQNLTDAPDSLVRNHCSKTKMSPGSNVGGNGFTLSGMRRREEQMWPPISDDSSSSSSSSSSSDDVDIQSPTTFPTFFLPKHKGNIYQKEWSSEAEMVDAFHKDAALCMKAVCSLYRQQGLVSKSPSGAATSQKRGFNCSDSIRATTLAEFLTDGNQQRKLNKSVADLEAYDCKGVDDCKRLAIQHSKQLFEIYKGNEDPFFFN